MKTGKSEMKTSQTSMRNDTVSSNSAVQRRRKNKDSMPRPKSTGYLKDFNILSAEDDVEDDSNQAYDDFVYATHTKIQDKTAPSGIYSADIHENKDLPNGHTAGRGELSINGDVCYSNDTRTRNDSSWMLNSEQVLPKRDRGREDFVPARNVSGRAAYWQGREDDSKKPDVFTSSIARDWKTPGQIRQMKSQVDPKEMTQYIYDRGVANRAAMWQKLEDEHFEKMMINPDKEWKGPAIRLVLDKSHPEYGRPPQGSKTEKRGIKAHKHVIKEIGELCRIIAENGEKQIDGTTIITFRKLFHTYVSISNKVVGILIRARKRGLLNFNGEMLYQRQDEDEIIQLFSEPDEVAE